MSKTYFAGVIGEGLRPQLILTSIITIGVLAAYFTFKLNKKMPTNAALENKHP
ncbi:hypothetical protein WAX46_03770 [Bacillus sp. FJAT-53060]|uniref:hypothetical protein n=1 Tax=Bacillus sp. FJAT-53060 TaxID=3127666 RepID=UPI0030140A47